MRTHSWLSRAGWLGAFAVTIWMAPFAGADEPPKPKVAGDAKVEKDAGPGRAFAPQLKRRVRVIPDLINDVEASGFRYPGKYTLKMSLTNVPKALDSQLALDGEGALVLSVAKDGPADKGGLKVHDILLATGDTPIKKISQVIESLNESDGKTLTLKVLREGKPMVITVTPEKSGGWAIDTKGLIEKRRAVAAEAEEAATEAVRRAEAQIREVEEQIHEKLKDAGVDVRMQLIQPGKIVPRDVIGIFGPVEDFPDDLNVEITKQGKEPAKIKVKQGDKSWKVTEEKLDELPDEVRKHVNSLLGRNVMRYSVTVPRRPLNVTVPKLSEEARKRARAAAEAARDRTAEMRERLGDRLERRLDEMSREMKQMRERMEELRRSLREKSERSKEGDEA